MRSSESPDQWSGDICTAVSNWARDLQTRAGQPPKSTRTVADGRAQLVDFISDVVTRTDEMLADVRAAGQPSVEDGDKIARDLLARLQSLRTTLVRADDGAGAFPRSLQVRPAPDPRRHPRKWRRHRRPDRPARRAYDGGSSRSRFSTTTRSAVTPRLLDLAARSANFAYA